MEFFKFLETTSFQVSPLGFFSEDFLLRQLIYLKMRKMAQNASMEFCFHGMEEDLSATELVGHLHQGGLFTQQRVHGLFFGSGALFTTARRKWLKPLQAYRGSDPVLWVGAFAFNRLWQKVLPGNMELVDPPRVQSLAELKRLHALMEILLPQSVAWSAWEEAWQQTGGMLSESYYDALKQTLLGSAPSLAEKGGASKLKNDLFTFVKKMANSSTSLAELIEESLFSLSDVSEWYPLLGLLHRQAQLKGTNPQRVWKNIAQVDHWMKHFVPIAEVHQIQPFAIVLLHKAFQMGSIRN